jgi:hypothetical protein
MYMTCHSCDGRGCIILKDSKGNETKAQRCPVCGGKGRLNVKESCPPFPYIPYPPYIDPCPCPHPYNPYPSCPDFIWMGDNDTTFTLNC